MEAIRARREKQEEKARKIEAGELEFEDPREAQLARQKKEEKKERRGRTGAKKGDGKGSPELEEPEAKKKLGRPDEVCAQGAGLRNHES